MFHLFYETTNSGSVGKVSDFPFNPFATLFPTTLKVCSRPPKLPRPCPFLAAIASVALAGG